MGVPTDKFIAVGIGIALIDREGDGGIPDDVDALDAGGAVVAHAAHPGMLLKIQRRSGTLPLRRVQPVAACDIIIQALDIDVYRVDRSGVERDRLTLAAELHIAGNVVVRSRSIGKVIPISRPPALLPHKLIARSAGIVNAQLIGIGRSKGGIVVLFGAGDIARNLIRQAAVPITISPPADCMKTACALPVNKRSRQQGTLFNQALKKEILRV